MQILKSLKRYTYLMQGVSLHSYYTTICDRGQMKVNGQIKIFAKINGQATISL